MLLFLFFLFFGFLEYFRLLGSSIHFEEFGKIIGEEFLALSDTLNCIIVNQF